MPRTRGFVLLLPMRKAVALICCAGLAALAWAQTGDSVAAGMASTARRFLEALRSDQRSAASIAFDSDERLNWHFIPRSRYGVSYKQLDPAQRELADQLLRAGLSDEGFAKAANIRSLDQVLFDDSQNPIRDPNLYFVSVFGSPAGTGDWGWRVEGHHLSLNFTVRQGQLVSTTPLFMGANPAEVRSGPRKGFRTLAPEEEMGRALLRSFYRGELWQRLILSADAPADIVTGASRKAEMGKPAGVAMSEMTAEQARLLTALMEMYAHRLRRELAGRELDAIRRAGMEKVYFAWAGGSEPGQPHYYRIQGPTFVIEYDNTQNNANHIHTVWRNFATDFGLDPLRAHYLASPHHRHAPASARGGGRR